MLGRLSNIVTLFLLASLGLMLARPLDEPWVKALFFALGLALISHLIFQQSRQRRLVKAVSRRSGGACHFMIDTDAHLDWDGLTTNFDETTARLLRSLTNQGPQDGRALKPSLEKAFARLKRLGGRFSEDPGPAAYAAWCLALLSQIDGREKACEPGMEVSENRMWKQAMKMREQAIALAPNRGSIFLDGGRILEKRAEVSGNDQQANSIELLEEALKQYEQAIEKEPELQEAWWGRGRVLGRLAMLSDPDNPDLDKLSLAVESFQTAEGDQTWPFDFYKEFGQVVYNLALHHLSQAERYFSYASELFLKAAKLGGPPDSLYHAGRSLYEAGLLFDDEDIEKAVAFYRKALGLFEQCAAADPRDALCLLLAARCQAARGKILLDENQEPVDKQSARLVWKLFGEAASFFSRASLIDPSGEIYAEWADILSIQAEAGGPRADGLWAEAVSKLALAAGCPKVQEDKVSIIWHNWAYALASAAETSRSFYDRCKILRDASDKYERAAQLNGNDMVTLKNWGDVLGDLSAMSSDPQDIALFTEKSLEIFQRATELYPGEVWPWQYWGLMIQKQARVERDPDTQQDMWWAASEKMGHAVNANPLNAESWCLWGRLLSEYYGVGPVPLRLRLIKSIIHIFNTAVHLGACDAETKHHLGCAQMELSKLSDASETTEDALGAASLAAKSFEKACALDPQLALHWAEWGQALFRASELAQDTASVLAALKQAHEKYMTAAALDPSECGYHIALGHILYQWGWLLEKNKADQKRDKFKKAYEHCAEAGRLSPYEPDVWRNWGKVAEALATVEKDPKKRLAWQNEATEKYYLADSLEPSKVGGSSH